MEEVEEGRRRIAEKPKSADDYASIVCKRSLKTGKRDVDFGDDIGGEITFHR